MAHALTAPLTAPPSTFINSLHVGSTINYIGHPARMVQSSKLLRSFVAWLIEAITQSIPTVNTVCLTGEDRDMVRTQASLSYFMGCLFLPLIRFVQLAKTGIRCARTPTLAISWSIPIVNRLKHKPSSWNVRADLTLVLGASLVAARLDATNSLDATGSLWPDTLTRQPLNVKPVSRRFTTATTQMSEPRQLRARKLVPVVLLPPGAGKSAPTKEAESATAVEASGNAVSDTVASQAVGLPTRSKKKTDASVEAIVNTESTPAVKRPRRSKKKNSKAVKRAPVRNSEPEKSAVTTDNESVTDTDTSIKAVVEAQPTQDEPSSTTADAMVDQHGLSSVTKTLGPLSTSEHQDTAKTNIPKTIRAYGRQKEVMPVDDPDTTPTQNLVSRDNRRKDDIPDAAQDIFYSRNPNARASNASASATSVLPLGLQATLINDSSGFLPSSPLSRTTGPAPRSRGLYKIRNRPDIPPLNVIDPALNFREPLTPDPASSDEEFDSTMPSDDGLPLPSASAVPHPGTNYFCRIGRAIEDLGYVGYRSRIGLAGPGDWAAYAPYICWYNRASHEWEQLPPGYTTEKPRALHDLAEVEAWWEVANIIAQERADELDDESAGAKESGQEAVEVESGREKESGGPKEDNNQAESMPEPDQDGEKGYRSSSCGSGSDFGETEEAKARQREWARKNRGRGHDEMDTAEEEADDEKRMEEEDDQDRRRMSKKKGRKGPLGANRSNELGEDQVSRGRQRKRVARKSKDNGGSGPGENFAEKLRRLAKSKPPAQQPSADGEGSDAVAEGASDEGLEADAEGASQEFAQKLHRLAKSKPPAQRPSADGEGSEVDADGASELPTARPVTSTKALGKRRDDPPQSMKRGPYTAHETKLAMELAETIVAHCKNMGRTPESVLRKGGFNVSLSREASRWDIWQMYLRYQPYNPRKSEGSWVTQAAAMYNNIVEKLSADQMDNFVEEMVSELAELRPEMDGQEFKITKTALKQVQDLATALGRADVDMIGIIIPRDPVANQAATVVTGNTNLQDVIVHCQADIKQMLHHLTTLLR
ncbi:uncharacterized protein LACBIDRAFT_331064 [Laccaria bicolor S238N-H82]|uniref:Predicted protein n=1 Tax=Laccaria bicolor (strain S238N-H82 / ATCC MYA-4686) TaxID=486041 RepID=B0DNB9_LACBS|nr:uncharacterized protein LACBIDRAFT_331064 [Laccaria bicolor S238N-H82]EDR03913.1 predicted protein [Laccaria bicolor S238N-H82]|eukprot:XP_001885481.1 predicted protein [Laccaria bicolor S238N-H82]